MFFCVNRIRVKGSTETYERVYREGSDFMATLPGHVRHKLLRSLREPDVYISVAEWRDEDAYRSMCAVPRVREIFDQVADIIDLENHECEVVYEGGEAP
ncbi:antibiotic biosynthesis monooxygenase [Thermomonospora umbrina]|uniref:Antibiotic biosynthesis monooxygenase n=2 Tax=Thermomonospora umbrina TaxID=111806 RepID=A0A3D9STD4_9ACTN|nr:antibiotic biosynthesis monooxygenase [Thermomonospora umbrina]